METLPSVSSSLGQVPAHDWGRPDRLDRSDGDAGVSEVHGERQRDRYSLVAVEVVAPLARLVVIQPPVLEQQSRPS